MGSRKTELISRPTVIHRKYTIFQPMESETFLKLFSLTLSVEYFDFVDTTCSCYNRVVVLWTETT